MFKMFKSFILLMLLAACSVHCSAKSPCGQKEIYNSNLDLAIDLIVRAKYTLPNIEESVNESSIQKAIDCADVLQMGHNKSAIYEVWPVNRVTEGKPLNVYCDMVTDGGGWTVIQRRGDFQGPEDFFYQDWENYKKGFGEILKDFWLAGTHTEPPHLIQHVDVVSALRLLVQQNSNDNMFALSNQKLYSVRFDLKDAAQDRRYALYDKFWIDDENHNYTLHISDYSGDAGDSMTYHNNQQFSTKDKDNDRYSTSCAVKNKGGWWFKSCRYVNLNGLYRKESGEDVIEWYHWTEKKRYLYFTEVKIRPKDFKPPAVTPL